MLFHSIDGICEVMKFILPTIDDTKIYITFDMDCSYLNVKLNSRIHAVKHFPNMRNICSKIVPLVYFYKKKCDYYNKSVYNILTKEIPLILPT